MYLIIQNMRKVFFISIHQVKLPVAASGIAPKCKQLKNTFGDLR